MKRRARITRSTLLALAAAACVTVDAQGNVYGAVERRLMLERHVKK